MSEGKRYNLNSSEYTTVVKEKANFINTQPELDLFIFFFPSRKAMDDKLFQYPVACIREVEWHTVLQQCKIEDVAL